MHRIAAAMLIAATVLAFNGAMLRDAFATQLAVKAPTTGAEVRQLTAVGNAKVLSLLMILETLRQAPVPLDGQKV